jgi:hypothetical protein
MSTTEILIQSIIDRLDRIESKLDSHISKDDKDGVARILEALRGWIIPVGCVLITLLGSGRTEPKQTVDLPTFKAVASSTYVAGKRIQGINDELTK